MFATTSAPARDKEQDSKALMEYENTRLYADNHLRFERLTPKGFRDGVEIIPQSDNKIIIKGFISNQGSRGIMDIGVTVFCVDHLAKSVTRTKKKIPSPDGKPLQRYDRRPYDITVDRTESSNCELKPLITSLTFLSS